MFVVVEIANELEPKDLLSYIDRKVSLGLAPNSGINVGAVGMGASEEVLYLGINVELTDLPPDQSIHAVQFLITNLALNSERKLHCLAVSSDGSISRPPCDLCRRFLKELRAPDQIKILIGHKDGNKYLTTFEGNLPPPDNLLPENYYRLLKRRNNGLSFLDPHHKKEICQNSDDDSHHCTNLKCMGLAAANKSYAPYSMCPSGVALRDSEGQVYRGWYMESAEYNNVQIRNPSVRPLQAALVDFVARSGGKKFKKINQVVLVEKKHANVRQEDIVRKILKKIAHPNCDFKVFNCSHPVEP